MHRGLRVICLENNDSVLSSLAYTTVEPGKYDRTFIQLSQHRVLKGIHNEDLRFWGKDELIAHTNIANFPKGNFRPLINLGNGKLVLIELVDGNGAYLISTLDIAKYCKSEPGAQILYKNLLDYALRFTPQSFSQTLLVGKPNSTLKLFFDHLGAEYILVENLTAEIVNQNQLATVIIDGTLLLNKKTRQILSAFIHHGGTVLIWGLIPESVNSYSGLLPYPLVLQECDIEHLVKTKPDPLLAGIHAGDLYWIERDHKHPILRYSVVPEKKQNLDVLFSVPLLDWRVWNWEAEPVKTATVLKSERAKKVPANGLVRFRIGKGTLLINQLCYEKTNFIKSGKVASLLLTNLGIRLNPENAILFTIAGKQEKTALLINPSG